MTRKTYRVSESAFAKINSFEGKNQMEKMDALITRLEELEAKEKQQTNATQPALSPKRLEEKRETTDDFLEGIPNSLLFKKDDEITWKGKTIKSLKGYPGVVKLRLKRMYETLLEMNQELDPDKQIKITRFRLQSLLNSNRNSTKEAWKELESESGISEMPEGKIYSFKEMYELEKEIFPDSKDLIFEAIIYQ